MVDPVTPRREEIARLAGGDNRVMIALERLFQVAGDETPAAVSAVRERVQAIEATPPDTGAAILEELRLTARGLSSRKVVFVADKYDFPMAQAGVITLESGVTYTVIGDVDLTGDRLVVGGPKTALKGLTQETSFLRSTGLPSGTALITSEFTFPISRISLTAATVLDLDATANPNQALDWDLVNFVDCPEIGLVKNFGNFIGNTIGVLNSDGWTFDGTFGTIAFSASIFGGTGAGAILTLPATLTVTRRFRVIYSAFVVFGGATGVDVVSGVTLPNEGLIFDTCIFSGGATYVAGADATDDIALWTNNIGIPNAASLAWYRFTGNATATVVATVNTPVKIAGTTIPKSEARFDATTTANRAVYTGAATRRYLVKAIISFSVATGDTCTFYVAKNGVIDAATGSTASSGIAGRTEGLVCMGISELSQGDFIEIWVENNSAGRNVTVSNLNVIVSQI